MSHFFTVTKQGQLDLLVNSINMDGAAAGNVLKAAVDSAGNIVFSPAPDDVGSSLPSGTEGQLLTLNSVGGLEWVDAPDSLPVVDGSQDGQVLTVVSGGWVSQTPALPSLNIGALTDVNTSALGDGHILHWVDSVGEWQTMTPPSPGSTIPDGTLDHQVLTWSGGAWSAQEASFYVGGEDNTLLETPNQLLVLGEADLDLNVGGVDDILAGDMETMVIVLSDWTSPTTGVATLNIKDGNFGQVLYVKNLSDQQDASMRTIKIKCGNGSAGSGSIDNASGIEFILSPMSSMKLVCINDNGDGDWVIL